jgi:phosphotriesterase-related protein
VTTINSVLGPLDTRELGFTLVHEHVLHTSAGVPQVFPEFIDRDGTIEHAGLELDAAFAAGVGTIVDATTMDLGRDVRLLEEVSRRSSVQVICATGNWLDAPRAFRPATPEMIAALYIREVQVGIEGTGIKAGIIKAATDADGITPDLERILRAVARAQLATGVPITTHSWAPERGGEQQVRLFEEEGVPLGRVCIGHSNDTTDTGYLLGLLRKGVWIGMDRFPGGRLPNTPGWEARTATLKQLIDAGFGHRIMLSHDRQAGFTVATRAQQESQRRYNPDGYLFITRHVLARLRQLGVAEQAVTALVVDNPRRFFEGT